MRLLLFILPTLLLTLYGQLITKWRVSAIVAKQVTATGSLERLLIYLTDPYILSAYAGSFLGAIAWLKVLENYPVSVAFPSYAGLLFACVILMSALLLQETISVQHIAGVLVILVGIAIVSYA